MHVSKLELSWSDRVECMLDEKMAVKRVDFTDVVQDLADRADDITSEVDVDFSIMTLELSAFIQSLVNASGGEKTPPHEGRTGHADTAVAAPVPEPA